MSDYISCPYWAHPHKSGSIHSKDKVPINLFTDQRNGKIYKNCVDCRNLNAKISTISRGPVLEYYKKLKVQHIEEIKNNKELITCTSYYHSLASQYQINKVPIQKFKKYPDRKISTTYLTCSDCRDYSINNHNDNKEILDNHCEKNNIVLCTSCKQPINDNNTAININGEQAKCCQSCKDRHISHYNNAKNIYMDLKYELIEKHESCCKICHSIFIVENENLTIAVEIPTFIIDNIRLCQYKNKIYTSSEFINIFKDQLILCILEFDHLLEIDQRKMGILSEDDIYEPKSEGVTYYRSKENIFHESNKCQFVCGKCHLIETIQREKGKKESKRPISEREKLKHTNNLKTEGCTNCHYVNKNLPRFFHFDHLDPLSKVTEIGTMVKNAKYTLNDMLNEIKKTRILCKYCHNMVTKNQRDNGLLNINRKAITTIKT